MIGYRCSCGMSHVDKAYDLNDVICDYCGRKGVKNKVEITKDNVINLSDIVWAWRFLKEEPMDTKGCLVKSCWGFDAGTSFSDIADWFVTELSDIIAYDAYNDRCEEAEEL